MRLCLLALAVFPALAQAQTIISEDYVNAYLFQLGVATVARAEITGLWVNQPTAAVDLTGVSWGN